MREFSTIQLIEIYEQQQALIAAQAAIIKELIIENEQLNLSIREGRS